MGNLKLALSLLIQSYLFIEVALVLLVVGGALLGYFIYSNNFSEPKVLGTDNVQIEYDKYQWGFEVSE